MSHDRTQSGTFQHGDLRVSHPGLTQEGNTEAEDRTGGAAEEFRSANALACTGVDTLNGKQ